MVQMFVSLTAQRTNFLSVGYTTAYLLCIAAFVFALICSANVRITFSKYNKIGSRSGLTGAEVARRILDRNGLYNVQVMRVSGSLTDNFDPRTNIVSLSDSVYDSTSLAAIGVAAHECGHAVQHSTDYIPIKVRSAVFPLARLGSSVYLIVFLLGLIFSFEPLVNAGIFMFLFVVLFQLVTLPVEFNASRRALNILQDTGILGHSEGNSAKKVLRAAALTYVASAAAAILQLLRLILLFGRNDRD